MSILEMSKELCRDHRMIKKVVENMFKTRNKGKGFKNMPSRDYRKLK